MPTSQGRSAFAPTPVAVHQRGPQPFEAPGQAELGQVSDVDQAGPMSAEIDRDRFIHQTEGKAGGKGEDRDPAQTDPERRGEGYFVRPVLRCGQRSAPHREQEHEDAEKEDDKTEIP